MSEDKNWEEFKKLRVFLDVSDLEEGSHEFDDGSTLYVYSGGGGEYYGVDGSSGHLYSGGGGEYYGTDGSSGLLYSGGGGEYYSADGSSGHFYSDGSGEYYGVDGSSGHIYSDGSGEYYGIDGETEYLDCNVGPSYSLNDNHGESSSIANAVGSLIGLGLAGYMIHKNKQENSRIEEEVRERELDIERVIREEEKKERRAPLKKHWKGWAIGLLAVAVLVIGGGLLWYYSNLIPMCVSPEEVQGMDYNELSDLLEKNGYSYIFGSGESDLDFADLDQEGRVIAMIVDDNKDFKKGSRYPDDVWIDIIYHSAKMVEPPASSKELKGKQYKKVKDAFKRQGFGNINTKGENDSFVTKWMDNEGEVKAVYIKGDEDYDPSSSYRVDEEIVIAYHKK